MKAKLLSSLVFIAAMILYADQLRKVDVAFQWQKPPGDGDMVYNIRILSESSLTYDYQTWPVLAVVTNSTTHILYHVWENQKFAISRTNVETGVESTQDIAPVHAKYAYSDESPVAMTNSLDVMPADILPEQQIEEQIAGRQNLKMWWQGPPNWQANGGVFNIRYMNGAWPPTNNYKEYPLWTRVTNILNTMYYNVNPTQFFCITFTNTLTGVESGDGIIPITGQYNWQSP